MSVGKIEFFAIIISAKSDMTSLTVYSLLSPYSVSHVNMHETHKAFCLKVMAAYRSALDQDEIRSHANTLRTVLQLHDT